MKYYAKVYTGTPATGLIAPGEMLTDKQVELLGEEKVTELCGRGVLGIQDSGNAAEAKAKPAKRAEEVPAEIPAEESEETEEELPELGGAEDLVSEAEAEPEKPAKKKRTRGRK